MLPHIRIHINIRPIMAALAERPVVARIFNDARSREGFAYFWSVDMGRREVRPVRARALRWVGRGGEVVFSMRSRRYAGRKMRAAAIIESLSRIRALERAAGWTRPGLVSVVNRVARMITARMAKLTPRGTTGKLAKGFRIEEAK